MKDIFDRLNQYKSLASQLENSGALKIAQSQHKLLDGISNIGISAVIKQQQKLIDLVGINRLSSITKHYDKIINATSLNAYSKTQLPLATVAGLATISSQHNALLQLIDNSLLKKLGKQQAHFQNAIANNSIIKSFAIDRRIPFLNSSTLRSFKDSSRILSDLHSVNSIVKTLEVNRFQNIIDDSFSLQLLNELKTEKLNFNDAIEVVEEAFSNKIETSSKGWISAEGLLQLFFAFTLYVISQASAMDSDEALMKKVSQLENSFIEKIALLLPDKQDDKNATYYIVNRTVQLHTESSTKSPFLGFLYPNQRVKLVKRKSKWIYIEYFDNLNGIPKMGWVYKKYLKMEKKQYTYPVKIVTSSPNEIFEKNKKRNFRSSSKLEGIMIPSKPAEKSLEEVLNKYREAV